MKKIWTCLLALMMVLLTACGGPVEKDGQSGSEAAQKPAGDSDAIYFAWYGPMTGDSKQYGDTEKVAVELALKDLEKKGWVLNGREIKVDFYDDKNDAKEAVNIANKIIGEKKYSAVIGGFGSTASMAAAPLYEEAKIVNYSPTASHQNFSSLGDFIFRNTPTQQMETTQYADYVYNKLGIKSIAILYVNDDWGQNIADIFEKRFAELGGKVTDKQSYIPNQTTDFSPMITSAKSSNPEAYFPIAYYQDSANILKQSKNLGFDVQKILSSSVLKQEMLDLAGEYAEGAFLMNAFTPAIDKEDFKRVMSEYTEKTGKEGDAFVMQTYDVVSQLAYAIEKAGSSDPVDIQKAMAGMKDYPCLAGEYSMNEIGDALRGLVPMKVIDGKFVPIEK
ncbi:ABC transporter substrate-binding protein [Kallipyga massiliensis]|uniref:ABC transporter substrate-binding protein n=1 Tax=Kallipyga massiliensis TaxID=1472764 RepID=UPI000567CA63|nr:ABC transporter substrate-binding protein [Kallipyga massiliensis]